MKLLREYIRTLLAETPATKGEIDDAIQNASFNSNNSSSHRWSVGQPYIDYWIDESTGEWKFLAGIPDGTPDADNWKKVESKPGELLQVFLTRVKSEAQKYSQLSLGL
jgi:hypothetical protein|tara:strand:+ start:582 stop:905 length:324 start_codon:yes stop_codon:yes gene_type:complete